MKLVRRLAIGLGGVLGLALVVLAALFVTLSLIDSPTYAWRVIVLQESDIGDYRNFPARPIAAAATPSPLPSAAEPWDPGLVATSSAAPAGGEDLDRLMARSETHALIVIQNDRVMLERYASGASREAINTSFSTAKSFSSALIGAAIADGFIGSVEDTVISYLPELSGRGLDALTIRDLLLMNTGIRYIGDDDQPFYMSPFGDDARSYYSADLRALALGVRAGGSAVGAAFRYNNYHPLLEGLILERVTGMPVAAYLEQRIWQPMGAEFPASWSLDSEASGFEKMESGINARAIDFARFGLLFLHGGEFNGRRILPADWVAESTMAPKPDERPWEVYGSWPAIGGDYAYHWWGLRNPDGTRDYMARGKFSQLIYVAPRKNAVVVRLGGAPDESVNWTLIVRNLIDRLP